MTSKPTISINQHQAQILFAALQEYQGGYEACMNGLMIIADDSSVNLLTDVCFILGEIEELKKGLCDHFEIFPE